MAAKTVGTLPDGSRGFDANAPISQATAVACVAAGYRFAIRYVRRYQAHSYDISSAEVRTILGAGLGLMIVQHVAPEGWTPTPDDGTVYGSTAARESHQVGIPSGVTVWLDLEGVAPHVPHSDTIQFCNNWFAEVKASGYEPGIYVGYGCGLTPVELYRRLRFTRYWSAYNLNADQFPAVRGVQMRQKVARASDLVHPLTNQNMDVDVIHADALGGTPTLLLP